MPVAMLTMHNTGHDTATASLNLAALNTFLDLLTEMIRTHGVPVHITTTPNRRPVVTVDVQAVITAAWGVFMARHHEAFINGLDPSALTITINETPDTDFNDTTFVATATYRIPVGHAYPNITSETPDGTPALAIPLTVDGANILAGVHEYVAIAATGLTGTTTGLCDLAGELNAGAATVFCGDNEPWVPASDAHVLSDDIRTLTSRCCGNVPVHVTIN